jgi:hypothetical protein
MNIQNDSTSKEITLDVSNNSVEDSSETIIPSSTSNPSSNSDSTISKVNPVKGDMGALITPPQADAGEFAFIHIYFLHW